MAQRKPLQQPGNLTWGTHQNHSQHSTETQLCSWQQLRGSFCPWPTQYSQVVCGVHLIAVTWWGRRALEPGGCALCAQGARRRFKSSPWPPAARIRMLAAQQEQLEGSSKAGLSSMGRRDCDYEQAVRLEGHLLLLTSGYEPFIQGLGRSPIVLAAGDRDSNEEAKRKKKKKKAQKAPVHVGRRRKAVRKTQPVSCEFSHWSRDSQRLHLV